MIKEHISQSIRVLSAIIFTWCILVAEACSYNREYRSYGYGPQPYPVVQYPYGIYRSHHGDHHNHKKDYRYGDGREYNGYNRRYGYTGNGTYIGKVW